MEFLLVLQCSAHTGPGRAQLNSTQLCVCVCVCAVCVMDSMLLDQTVQIDGWMDCEPGLQSRERERERTRKRLERRGLCWPLISE